MSELKVYKVYTTRNEGAFGFCEGADPTDIELEHESVCLKSEVDAAIAELKEALNEAESSRYEAGADAADYYQENRRLKRALWLARAERAKYRVEYWACRGGALFEHYPFCVNGDSPFNRLSEMGFLYGDTNERLKEAKFKHLYASEWMLVWDNVEHKCLKKAEQYR